MSLSRSQEGAIPLCRSLLIDRAARQREEAEQWLRDVEHIGLEKSGQSPADIEKMRRVVAFLKGIEAQR